MLPRDSLGSVVYQHHPAELLRASLWRKGSLHSESRKRFNGETAASTCDDLMRW